MFQTDKMDAFFLVGTPREREFRIDPEGGQYVHRTDKRIRLDFPEGSVAEPQNFKVTVGICSFLRKNVSYCIHMDYSKQASHNSHFATLKSLLQKS